MDRRQEQKLDEWFKKLLDRMDLLERNMESFHNPIAHVTQENLAEKFADAFVSGDKAQLKEVQRAAKALKPHKL